MECVICCEQGVLCECPFCKQKACLTCVKRWILSQPSATCMNCSHPWLYSLLKKILPKSFVNTEYKNYILENISKEEERLFNDLQRMKVFQICLLYLDTYSKRFNIPFVSMNLHSRRHFLLSQDIMLVRRVAPWLYDQIEDNLVIDPYYKEGPTTKEQHELLFKIIRKQIKEYIPRIEMIDQLPDDRNDSDFLLNKNRFPCPVKDCKGCVLRDRCILCLQKVCPDCWEIKESEHKCDPVKLYNVDEVKKNSQICPTCSVRINRNGGCNTMFCVLCKTQFNYASGKKTYHKNELHATEEELNTIANSIALRSKPDETYRLKLRLFHHLNLIDKNKFLTQNYYFWRITQLEIEEAKLLKSLNDIEPTEEDVNKINQQLELLAKSYDVVPIQVNKDDPYTRRRQLTCSNKELREIIERFV